MRAAAYSPAVKNSRATAANQGLADRIGQHAAGALVGQKVRYRLRNGEDPSIAFDELLAVTDRYGLNSPATAAFVKEVAKSCA